MNTQQLSPETIATLAEWDGWEKEDKKDPYWKEYCWVRDDSAILDSKMTKHFTDPRTLIRMRNEISKREFSINNEDEFNLVADIVLLRMDLDKLILTEQYHAAADKTAEIIKKLKV